MFTTDLKLSTLSMSLNSMRRTWSSRNEHHPACDLFWGGYRDQVACENVLLFISFVDLFYESLSITWKKLALVICDSDLNDCDYMFYRWIVI